MEKGKKKYSKFWGDMVSLKMKQEAGWALKRIKGMLNLHRIIDPKVRISECGD
jgi:hypothetical protein